MTMPIIDFVFLIIVLAFAIIGFLKGFLNGVFSIAAPIAGLWAAFVFCDKLSVPLETYVKIHWLSTVIACLLIFILVFLIVKIVEKILKGIFSGGIFISLDRVLGLLLGLAEGVAVVTIILVVLKAQPWFETDTLLAGSIFYRVLGGIVEGPAASLPGAVEKASSAGIKAVKDAGI